ncbi:hypothetical protein ACKQTC_01680 [Peptococcus simiae]|uniref:Uncharacterized protein n=1 Tax=Peptococcus simiae TaxID=1643805 RepID=A0ABW9GYT9_9FIRM
MDIPKTILQAMVYAFIDDLTEEDRPEAGSGEKLKDLVDQMALESQVQTQADWLGNRPAPPPAPTEEIRLDRDIYLDQAIRALADQDEES